MAERGGTPDTFDEVVEVEVEVDVEVEEDDDTAVEDAEVDLEANPADALEQSRAVPVDEDEYR